RSFSKVADSCICFYWSENIFLGGVVYVASPCRIESYNAPPNVFPAPRTLCDKRIFAFSHSPAREEYYRRTLITVNNTNRPFQSKAKTMSQAASPAAVTSPLDVLQEFSDNRGVALRVDRSSGVIQGVKLLGTVSKKDREYPVSVI